MRRGAIALLVALGLLIAAFVALFLRYYDLVEETRPIPASGEARTNPYYALELLYSQMGAPARDVIGWHRLPPTDHALMLLGARYTEEDQRTEKLLAWVESGGHLIVVPQAVYQVALDHRDCEYDDEPENADENAYEGPIDMDTVDGQADEDLADESPETWPESDQDYQPVDEDGETTSYWYGADEDGDGLDEPVEDPITDPIGIRVGIPPHDDWLDSEAEIVNVETERGSRRILVETLPALIDPDNRALFRGSGSIEVGDGELQERTYLLRIRYGQGLVTALNGTELFNNQSIGDNDHATFAWDVVSPPDRRPAGVWIVGRDRYPGLMEVLREQASLALVSGLLLLIVYLWHKGMRFGPPISDALPERRSVLEHISATADFYWRSQMAGVLLESSRRSALRRLENRDPTFCQLGDNERIEHLSELSGISQGQLRRALSDHAAEDPTEFTRTVRTLERLSRSTTRS